MIIEIIISWFADAAVWFFGLFPDWDPPDASSWATTAGSVWNFAGWVNQYLPLDIALGLLAVLMVIWLGNHVLRVTIYVLTKLHILGGAD